MADATTREWRIAYRLAERIKAEPEKAANLIARKLSQHREACVAYELEQAGMVAVLLEVA